MHDPGEKKGLTIEPVMEAKEQKTTEKSKPKKILIYSREIDINL